MRIGREILTQELLVVEDLNGENKLYTSLSRICCIEYSQLWASCAP